MSSNSCWLAVGGGGACCYSMVWYFQINTIVQVQVPHLLSPYVYVGIDRV